MHRPAVEKFNESPMFKDVFFTLLFLLHFAGVVGIFISGLAKDPPTKEDTQEIFFTLSNARPVIGILVAVAAIGLVIACIWLLLSQKVPRALIQVSIVFSVCTWIALAIFLAAMGVWIAALIMFVLAGVNAFFFYLWRNRIPFAATLLQTVSHLISAYPSTVVLAIGSLFIQLAWSAFWVVAVVYATRYQTTPAAAWGIMVYMIFSYYWVSQVIKNVVHTSVSGSFATWYFMSTNMPTNPTAKSFKRAITYSFGSICLGSLLVAALQTMRAILRNFARRSDNAIMAILACLIEWWLSCIEGLLRYFNHYAYVMIAIYGKSFWQAARDTFDMFQETGLQVIVNDNIIGTVLAMGCWVGGFLTGVAGGVLGWVYLPEDWIFLAVVGLVVGFTMVAMTLQVVESGVSTIFVCFAEDPAALARNDAYLFNLFMSTYREHLHHVQM